MKMRYSIIVLAIFLLTGCGQRINNNDNENTEFTRLQLNDGVGSDVIRILKADTRVGYEEFATISIIGKPGVTYSITSNYKWGGQGVTAFEKRKANSDGVATWIWKVRSNTSPGTYPVVISGGGQKLETSYTVLP